MDNSEKEYTKVVDSRAFLPIEMLLACMTIIAGIAGGVLPGTLKSLLEFHGETYSWFAPFFIVGLVSAVLTTWDWVKLRDAPVGKIMYLAGCRSILNFLTFATWAGGLYVVVKHGYVAQSMLFVALTPCVIVFSAWCYWENHQVSYATNPKIKTSRLQYSRFHR